MNEVFQQDAEALIQILNESEDFPEIAAMRAYRELMLRDGTNEIFASINAAIIKRWDEPTLHRLKRNAWASATA